MSGVLTRSAEAELFYFFSEIVARKKMLSGDATGQYLAERDDVRNSVQSREKKHSFSKAAAQSSICAPAAVPRAVPRAMPRAVPRAVPHALPPVWLCLHLTIG